jgi:methionyl-tRNA formyltransferase
VSTLDGIEDGTLHPVPQPPDGVSLAPKITVEDARVDWKTPAQFIDRQVRACTPAPGAWTTLGGERVKLFPLVPLPGAAEVEPGRIVLDKRGMTVGTGSGHLVRLGDVQPQGRKRMSAADWARGLRPADETARFE